MNPQKIFRPLAVLFDMDGVLVDSEPFIERAAILYFKEQGQSVDGRDFIPFIGTGENRYLGGVAEKYALHIDAETAKKRLYQIYFEIIKGALTPIPGAVDFLGECRKRSLRTALATSADASKMNANLQAVGISPAAFDFLICGDQIRQKKPHPEVFLRAATGLGVLPNVCLVVEDAVNGVIAGKKAGCHVLGLTTSFSAEKLLEAGADWTAPDFLHLPKDLFF